MAVANCNSQFQNNNFILYRQSAPSFYYSLTNGPIQDGWITVHAIYARGSLGFSLTGDSSGIGLSVASLEIGAVDVDVNIPFGETNCGLLINFGTFKAETSIGLGLGAQITLIGGEVGLNLGNCTIKVGGYAGAGFILDFTTGFRFSIGLLYGLEINIEFNWLDFLGLR